MKENNMANLEQYRAVLEDLLKQKDQLKFRIGEIDSAVAALRRLMPAEEIAARKDIQTPLPITVNGKYSGMSNRWAILSLLAEDATSPLSTGDIADALLAGGITSEGKSFSGNVSAVLSKMNHDRKEIVSRSQGWIITEVGKQAWIAIKASRERKQGFTEASLPTVQ
jgi:hypothetical protein